MRTPPADLTDKIHELALEQTSLKAELVSLTEQFKLGKEISDLRGEFNKTIGSAKLFITAFSIIVAALGIAGYKTTKDIEGDVQKRIEAQNNNLQAQAERELALSRAYGALTRKEYDSAIRIFEEQFEPNPYDLAVIVPLLNAYDSTDNWDEAEKRILRLEQDDQKLNKTSDAALFNNVALIRIEEGVDDPVKLQSGINYLKRSSIFIRADDEDAWTYFHINSWLAALAARDMVMAEKEASQIAVRDSTVTLDEWYKVRRWKFFRHLLRKNPELELSIKKMWETQREKLDNMHKGKK